MNAIKHNYKKMLEIRCFEEKILELFGENKLSGTTHTYIGQEAIAVAVMNNISDEDKIFSNHRCHGHYLAYGGPKEKLLAEIMSKQGGMCEGRGGSQHIQYRNFYSNGIQGGIVPNAMGMAWAEKLNDTNNIVVVFLGDGTLGQGVVYEAFNMAKLYEVPILFVVEDNKYAMSTKIEEGISGSMIGRTEAFGIKGAEVESNDVEVLEDCFKEAINYVRNEKQPFCQVVHTYRLSAHSKGDDYRDKDEIAVYKKKDPIVLAEQKIMDEAYIEKCKTDVKEEIERMVTKVECDTVAELNLIPSYNTGSKSGNVFNTKEVRCLEEINSALNTALAENKDIILIGEDIRDEFGGAFKVTKGLSLEYSEQVINSPISEAGIIGAGVGLALNGKVPIIEIMFGDFLTLGFDQILNHATKYSWVYGNGIQVPLIIRTPMGGGRGYGATHSQSLEKFLLGIPMLSIMALAPIYNISELYKYAISNVTSPLVVIENKKMYSEKLLKYENGRILDFFAESSWQDIFPTIKLTLDKESKADITLITYGGMVKEVMEAATEILISDEILVDVIVVSQISPLPLNDLEYFLRGCNIIGTVEEGTKQAGWGAEIIASLLEKKIGKKFFRTAALNLPLPNGVTLEKQILPDKQKIIDSIRRAL